MIKYEIIHALTIENPCNLNAYLIIEIFLVLHSAHIVFRDKDKFVFDVNNYIIWDLFNQLYDPNWMQKGEKNIDVVARKLRSISIRATNDRLEVAKEEKQKRKEMIEKRKAIAMAAKHCRARKGIGLSREKKNEYQTRNDMDLNLADNKYPLQL